jgi:hypothetical protein
MNHLRPSDQFFEHLLRETFEFLPESEVLSNKEELLERFNVLDARERFCPDDAVLFNYLNKHHIIFSDFKFIAETQMFRLKLHGKDLDIPSNWYFFSDYSSQTETSFNLKMFSDENTEEFFEVLSSLLNKEIAEINMWHTNGRSYVLYLDQAQAKNAEIRNWLNNYFLIDLEDNSSQKKAA